MHPPFRKIRALMVNFIFYILVKGIYSKPALTYQKQLQQLKERGLTIDNDTKVIP